MFFKKDDSNRALFTLADMLKGFNMSEKVLFGSKSKCNSKYSLPQVLQLLIMFPCFMIREPYNCCRSSLSGFFGSEKDVFYRYVNNEAYNWRKILYHFTIRIWNKVRMRSDHMHQTVWLMVDDSDFPRTARHIENTGRIYSHLRHKTIPGFKSLFLGITNGKSRFVLDFSITGEKGGKMGVVRYGFEGKEPTARALINLLEDRRIRKIGGQYITADVRFAGTDVRLYFVKRKKESWNGMMTTSVSLEFLEAYRIHAMRWSLEVFFKETKRLMGMGKCQSRNFAVQLAATTTTALQYNLLSLVNRFTSYETIGGIFRDLKHTGMELSVSERIWGIILEMVKIMTDIFPIEEEEIFEAIMNKSVNLAHLINFYELKSASQELAKLELISKEHSHE